MTLNSIPMTLGAYWGARKESLESSATRIHGFLSELHQFDDSLNSWYRKAMTRDSAKQQLVPLDINGISDLLRFKQSRRESDGAMIPELGYGLSIWNGNENNPADFTVTCGSWSPYVGNAAVLEVSDSGSNLGRKVCDRSLAEQLMKSMVRSWDPDWAVISPLALLREQYDLDFPIRVGWLTFVRISQERIPIRSPAIRHRYFNGTAIELGGDPKGVRLSDVLLIAENLARVWKSESRR